MRTKIEASEPSPMRMNCSGADAGSSIPAPCSASRINVARPMKKTSLPRAPACQPVTEYVSPFGCVAAYQSMNGERVSTSPAIQVMTRPVCTGAVWANRGGDGASGDHPAGTLRAPWEPILAGMKP